QAIARKNLPRDESAEHPAANLFNTAPLPQPVGAASLQSLIAIFLSCLPSNAGWTSSLPGLFCSPKKALSEPRPWDKGKGQVAGRRCMMTLRWIAKQRQDSPLYQIR